MMKSIKLLFIIGLTCFTASKSVGQSMLSKEEAVRIALENNLGIQLAQNSSEIAKNNTSIYNSGKLPFVSMDGGYNYSLDNTSAKFMDGTNSDLSFASSHAANTSLGASYVLFDGYFRKHNTRQLQERYALSELEVEAAMENIAAQALSQYYNIASLVENLKIIEEAINISERRLEREKQKFEFGQGSQLAILNAQVDLNNDSLSYFNAEIQLDNAKRLLNNIMGEKGPADYTMDPDAEFINTGSKEQMKDLMLKENLALSQVNKQIEIGNISIDLANARKLPTIGTNLSYGYSYNKNNSASFLSSQNSHGLKAGLTVSWNIFDGGATKHALENARLNNLGIALDKERITQDLEFEFNDAWANYENRLLIYETQLKNVIINRNNFLRSEEQFKIGQINSVDYRQAQLNLLNAETVLNTSKFQVKISEVELLLLSGQILD